MALSNDDQRLDIRGSQRAEDTRTEREITSDDFQQEAEFAVTSTTNSPFVCIISRLSTEPTLLLKGSRPTGQFRVCSTTSSNYCDAGGSRPRGQSSEFDHLFEPL